MITVEEYTAPACWASYLVNGDSSGISDEDVAQCDAWVESLNGAIIVSVADNEDGDGREEPWFSHSSYDAWSFVRLACDCFTYIAHRAVDVPDVDHPSVLRNVRIESPLRDHAPLRLLTWDTGKTYEPWRTRIGVALYRGDESEPLIVSYFGMGMGQTIDGDESLVAALSTVCMRPGDTDTEYFADYTPRALEWTNDFECEALQCVAFDIENNDDAPYYEMVDRRWTLDGAAVFQDVDHG